MQYVYNNTYTNIIHISITYIHNVSYTIQYNTIVQYVITYIRQYNIL